MSALPEIKERSPDVVQRNWNTTISILKDVENEP